MSAPVVTVVIPTRNRRALLMEAVESVAEQEGISWELIVVDDASEDGTVSWLSQLGDSRIRHIGFSDPQERSVARNAGLKEARGRYVLFLDDDDVLRRGALSGLAAAMACDAALVVAVGRRIEFDTLGATRRSWHPRRSLRLRRPWVDVLTGWYCYSGQALMRTEAVKRAGAWDSQDIPAEDIALLLRLGRLGPFRLLPRSVLSYRVHPGQQPRPPGVDAGMRIRFVETLHGPDLRLGQQALASRFAMQKAYDAFLEARTKDAIRLHVEMLFRWPRLLGSPVRRALIARPLLRSLLGPRLLQFARQTRRSIGSRRPGEVRAGS